MSETSWLVEDFHRFLSSRYAYILPLPDVAPDLQALFCSVVFCAVGRQALLDHLQSPHRSEDLAKDLIHGLARECLSAQAQTVGLGRELDDVRQHRRGSTCDLVLWLANRTLCRIAGEAILVTPRSVEQLAQQALSFGDGYGYKNFCAGWQKYEDEERPSEADTVSLIDSVRREVRALQERRDAASTPRELVRAWTQPGLLEGGPTTAPGDFDVGTLIPNIPRSVQTGPPDQFYAAAMRALSGLRAWTALLFDGSLGPDWVPDALQCQAFRLKLAARAAWVRGWLGQCFCRPDTACTSRADLLAWCRFQRTALMLVPGLQQPFCSSDGRPVADGELLCLALPLLSPETPPAGEWVEAVRKLHWDDDLNLACPYRGASDAYSPVVRAAWDRLRCLPGTGKPVMPSLPTDADGAAAALNQIVLWCGGQRESQESSPGEGEPPPHPPHEQAPDEDFVCKATTVILTSKDWTAQQCADWFGISRATWFRRLKEYPALQALWSARKVVTTSPPRGYKDADGNLEGWDDAG